jgi:hypothetical protein
MFISHLFKVIIRQMPLSFNQFLRGKSFISLSPSFQAPALKLNHGGKIRLIHRLKFTQY